MILVKLQYMQNGLDANRRLLHVDPLKNFETEKEVKMCVFRCVQPHNLDFLIKIDSNSGCTGVIIRAFLIHYRVSLFAFS